jgi:alpha-beta hydrolase superfamily lysophospholipase
MIKKSFKFLLKTSGLLLLVVLVVFATVLLGAAWNKRSGPDLHVWHRAVLESEYSSEIAREGDSLSDYLDLEDALFDEMYREIVRTVPQDRANALNRYSENSLSYPDRNGQNFNRTFEFAPIGPNQGAVLLLHGMTDGPYSMRHLADIFHQQGFYVLNMRMPGHGTIPSELARVDWRDWLAAVRIGVTHTRQQATPGKPFWIVGYSNGAALALKHTLDAIDNKEETPDRLVLLSPMIGIDSLARITKYFYWLGKLDWFEKSLWLDILPEYDPHKYNSFPMNGPVQSRSLTLAVSAQVRRLASEGKLDKMPPILTFQSLVDSTVITRALGRELYDQLPDNGSELVFFDVNRRGFLNIFIGPETNQLFHDMIRIDKDNYALTVISNRNEDSLEVSEWHKPVRSTEISERPLGLNWPETFYSLSHVALPFPPNDLVYGYTGDGSETGFPQLGTAQWLGESGALTLPSSLYTRARANPFFSYIQQRLDQVITEDSNLSN